MNKPKSLLGLYILEILRHYSDEAHRLTQQDIAEYLRQDYDLTFDRKAIRRHLENLLEAGYELEYTEIPRRGRSGEDEPILTGWYLIRSITGSELRLLIDGMLFSKRIPYSPCIIALFHDLSKAGVPGTPQYIPNEPTERQRRAGYGSTYPYSINRDLTHLSVPNSVHHVFYIAVVR